MKAQMNTPAYSNSNSNNHTPESTLMSKKLKGQTELQVSPPPCISWGTGTVLCTSDKNQWATSLKWPSVLCIMSGSLGALNRRRQVIGRPVYSLLSCLCETPLGLILSDPWDSSKAMSWLMRFHLNAQHLRCVCCPYPWHRFQCHNEKMCTVKSNPSIPPRCCRFLWFCMCLDMASGPFQSHNTTFQALHSWQPPPNTIYL